MLELRFIEGGRVGIQSLEVWLQTHIFIIYKDFVHKEFRLSLVD